MTATAHSPQLTTPTASQKASNFLFPLVFAVLSFSLMQTLLVPALPTFAQEFGIASTSTSWILTSFLLTGAIAAPVLGSFGDRHGHRLILIIVLSFFTAGSLLAALAPNFAVLLLGRVLQGASTATFPLALAIVRRHMDSASQPTAIGWLSGTIGLGAGAALVIGGAILEATSWQWLFALGAVMGAVSIALILAAVPASHRGAAQPTDWAGIALLAAALVSLMLAISQGNLWGWTSWQIVALIAATVVSFTALIFHENRTPAPLIDMKLLAKPALALTNGITLFIGFVPYLFYVGLPVLFQTDPSTGFGQSFTVTQTGLALAPAAILSFVGGRLAPLVIARIGVTATAFLAFIAMGSTGAAIAVVPGNVAAVIALFALFGLANGVGFTVIAELVTKLSPRDEVASSLGVNGVVRTVGSAFGAPIATVVMASQTWGANGLPTSESFSVLFAIAAIVSIVGSLFALYLRPSS